MADFGSPVAQNVNVDPNKGLTTLSSLIGLKQQQQTLDTGAILQKSARAKATVETQAANENQALAQLLQDPVGNGIIDAKGNPTVDGQAKVMQVAPTTGASHYGDLVNAARTKIDFNTSVNNLNAQERQEVGSVISGAAAGAKSPDEVQAAVQSLLDSKQGTPVFDDYQKIADTAMHIVGHTAKAAPNAQPGQEPWRQAALGIGRQVLGAQGVVGAGGIANPQATTNAAGQTQNRNQITGALSAPQVGPGTSNPASPQVAGQTTRQTQTGNADIDTSNAVVAAQRDAKANIDLTRRIDQLAEVIQPGAAPAKISQGLAALGLQDANQARTELQKDLGRLRGNLANRSGSDQRAAAALEGLPTDTSPTQTIHQAMDVTRGFARQDIALGNLRNKSSKETNGQMNGFQGDYAHAVSAASPLMHEYLALSPEEKVEFFKRNFATKAQARAFRDQAESVKKRSPDAVQ